MTPDQLRQHLSVEIDRLLGAIDSLDRPLPTCEGWTNGHLLAHLDQVWRLAVAASGSSEAPRLPARPIDAELPAAAAASAAALVEHLAGPLDTPAWSWVSGADGAWWLRRQVHELVIHRIDAELAAGRELSGVDAELASDGIDEHLVNYTLGRGGYRRLPPECSLHLHCTDVEGEWMLRLPGPELTREHAKGQVAARGPAAELYRALWRRRPDTSTIEVFGEQELWNTLTELTY